MRTRKRRDGIEKKSGAKDLADARGGDFFSDVLDMYASPEFIRLRKTSVGRAGFERDKAAIRSYFRMAREKAG